jgi:hypothetical protein
LRRPARGAAHAASPGCMAAQLCWGHLAWRAAQPVSLHGACAAQPARCVCRRFTVGLKAARRASTDTLYTAAAPRHATTQQANASTSQQQQQQQPGTSTAQETTEKYGLEAGLYQVRVCAARVCACGCLLCCGVVWCRVPWWCGARVRVSAAAARHACTHTHTHTRTHARTHTTLRAARAYAGADIKGRRRQRRAREPHGAGQAAAGAVRVCVPAHLHLVRHRVVCCLLRGRERRWAGVCVRGACAWGVGGGGGSVCAWGVCIGCVWCVWEGGSGGLLQLPGCSWSRVWHTQRGGTHGTSLPPDPQPHAHTRTRARAHANHRPPPPAPRQAWTWRACSRASASL